MTSSLTIEVTIVGAGPYGLSLAAHLEVRRVPFRIIGLPMDFWQRSMPRGMSLKSEGPASSIYDPSRSFMISHYCAEENIPYADFGVPVSLETFISYGLAFQQRYVPSVEQLVVTTVKKHEDGFTLSLDTGETFTTRKLVLAIGVGYFSHVPSVLSNLPNAFVTHSSQHVDLNAFADQDVAIIGAGASALDLAALLDQVRARPVVITRQPSLRFHDRPRLPRTILDRLRAPSSGIGAGWPSWIYCKFPLLFHYLPERQRLKMTKTKLGPVGGWFIKDAVVGRVPTIVNSRVVEAFTDGGRVHLRLRSNKEEIVQVAVNQVIAATGYRVDVDRITFLDETLRIRIDTAEKAPILSSNFETSIPGLYFIGPAAANSFGPIQRFAVGAKFAARRVSRSLANSKSSRSDRRLASFRLQ